MNRRRAGGRAHDELDRWVVRRDRVVVRVLDGMDEKPEPRVRNRVEGLPNGSQWWSYIGCDGDVIVTDDAHVLGNPAPALEQRADQADGHVVVGREHGGHR